MAEQFTDYNRLVPLRTGLDPADAQLLKSVLTASGVEVFLNGENMGALNYAVRTDVMVRAIDKARADQVISKIATMPRCQLPHTRDMEGEELSCSHCGSSRVHKYEGAVPTFFPGIRQEALPEDGWFHCLQCDSYFRTRMPKFASLPIAFIWSLTVAAAGYALYWLIDWIKWL